MPPKRIPKVTIGTSAGIKEVSCESKICAQNKQVLWHIEERMQQDAIVSPYQMYGHYASVAELVDASDLGSDVRKGVGVRASPGAQINKNLESVAMWREIGKPSPETVGTSGSGG